MVKHTTAYGEKLFSPYLNTIYLNLKIRLLDLFLALAYLAKDLGFLYSLG